MEQPENGRWADAQVAEIVEEPYYLPVGDEVTHLRGSLCPEAASHAQGTDRRRQDPLSALYGPSPRTSVGDVACHDDLTASDLLGRYLIKGDETIWIDGPLTHAVRIGAICYLDEIVEARKDTTVVIHPLTDDRRRLRLEKTGELLVAPPEFLLVISYNPGYQSLMKNLKPSTRQRFVALDFDFPPSSLESRIVEHESGVAGRDRRTTGAAWGAHPQPERFRTGRTSQHAPADLCGMLISCGISPRRACELAIAAPITDDQTVQAAVLDLVTTVFPA